MLMNSEFLQMQRLNSNFNKSFQKLSENLKNKTKEEAMQACLKFESIFVKQMLKTMTKTLKGNSLLGDKPGYDYYQDIFLNKVSENISENSDLGIAKQIFSQISQHNNTESNIKIRKINHTDHIRNASQEISNKIKSQLNELPDKLNDRLEKYQNIITRAAQKFDVNENMIKAIISQESYGNPKAVSSAGAKGLMQLMESTAEELGVTDIFNVKENIMGGVKYFKKMLDKFENSELALAAYNAGPSNVEKYKGIPPFDETTNYVKKVMNYFNKLDNNYQKK